MARLKAYGGNAFIGGKQRRVVIVASSMAEAVRMAKEPPLYLTEHFIRTYWSQTATPGEVALISNGKGMWAYEGNLIGEGIKSIAAG